MYSLISKEFTIIQGVSKTQGKTISNVKRAHFEYLHVFRLLTFVVAGALMVINNVRLRVQQVFIKQ